MKLSTFKNQFVNYIYQNQKLAQYTWFGVGGNAEILYMPEEEKYLEKGKHVNKLATLKRLIIFTRQ